ncbi:hypothetical protein M595_3650 [Lyngbya aestuarii BL J]|uniref:Uncharacterized protein n=1 Tax=Lyngbya aestuarii BL J TaxID=1348334 RepID=U7QH81_9CYAN|nr:hypothetical protein M595_3650 [Lyngbya aestuarii BL J]
MIAIAQLLIALPMIMALLSRIDRANDRLSHRIKDSEK